jgi:uncharacterized protein YjlB
VFPAGVGHSNAGPTFDLLVVDAYPNGMDWDMRLDNPSASDEARVNIAAVLLPDSDPVHGPGGPLTEIWGDLQP